MFKEPLTEGELPLLLIFLLREELKLILIAVDKPLDLVQKFENVLMSKIVNGSSALLFDTIR